MFCAFNRFYLNMSASRHMPIPVASRSQAWFCGCSLAGVMGSNPSEDMDVCLF